MFKLAPDTQIIKKGQLRYITDDGGRLVGFKPWMGNYISYLYDFTISNSVFPKKFGADLQKHYAKLSQTLSGFHGNQILELGTGSGSAVRFLNNNNHYAGVDVSPGLLKQAARRFIQSGFPDPEFYAVSADDLPFARGVFDLCLSILSLNFIGNIEQVFCEVRRVLRPEGELVCCVPVPERNKLKSTIRGILYTEKELEKISQDNGFEYEQIPFENGALLYFKAIKVD